MREIKGKIIIKGIIKSETGLHIGGAENKTQIGGIDKPVIRDSLTQFPFIPGSSLKGKLRSLLERFENKNFNKNIGKGVRIHACTNIEDANKCKICRLFGSTGEGRDGTNYPSKLIFRDCFITDEYKNILENTDTDLLYTEFKYENSIDRITSSANPRQLERVPAGTEFDFEIIYEINDDLYTDDIETLFKGLNLLEKDYLGGNGSRGYGKIKFRNLKILKISKEDFGSNNESKFKDVNLTNIGEIKNLI